MTEVHHIACTQSPRKLVRPHFPTDEIGCYTGIVVDYRFDTRGRYRLPVSVKGLQC